MAKELKLPPDRGELKGLSGGEELLLFGEAFTMRDAACSRLSGLVERGAPVPFDLEGQLVFHAGPAPPGAGRPCVAVGPTTTARMDVFLPLLLRLGVAAILGKGPRGRDAVRLHGEHGAVYLAAVGGAGALLGGKVTGLETVAWEDLGPESVFRMWLEAFPAVVAVDSSGFDFMESQRLAYGRPVPEGLD